MVFMPSSKCGTTFSFKYTLAGAPPGRTCVVETLRTFVVGVLPPPLPFVCADSLPIACNGIVPILFCCTWAVSGRPGSYAVGMIATAGTSEILEAEIVRQAV